MAGMSALPSARRSRCAPDGADSDVPHSRGGLARRRAELEARWRETLERVTTLSVAYHDATASRLPGAAVPSAARAGGAPPARQDGAEATQLARRVVAERQALAEIEAALDRIALDQYGRCEQCHRPISARLLALRPEVRFCSDCSRRPAPVVAYA
jgi:RNA polymerase-binding transcription factor DksA